MGEGRDDTVRDQVATLDLGAKSAGPVPASVDLHADRFEALGELGRGGMGRVEDAFDRVLGRQVAIKRMLSDSSIDMARFEREARITARLEHPGIVPVHDVGRSADGTPYYVMRRVDGRPLSEVVEGKSLVERLALVPNVLAACEAMGYAHARSVVHRDIKPTNILVGPFGETLVIDWGLARETGEARVAGPAIPASDPSLTRAGTVAGTPGFMAPEQARGESVDARADVFALGATLFHVLAGRTPYASSEGATEMIAAVGSDRPPEWKLIPVGVPADLRAILTKSMAATPAQRYPDAGALAADLRRFVTGNLVGARHYSRLDQLRRFIRRHRATVAVAALSVVLLGVVATLSIRRIVAERDAADVSRELAETRQHETARTADRLLMERARELVDRDPTAAVALLRELPPESELWSQAATVAQAAAVRGIPFGFSAIPNARLAFSPNGARLATADLRGGGPLTIYDLVARTARTVGKVDAFDELIWSDDEHLVVATSEAQLVSIDRETGASRARALPRRASSMKVDRSGQLWIELTGTTTLDRQLVELPTFDADLVPVASNLRGWNIGAVVVADHDHLQLQTQVGTANIGPDDVHLVSMTSPAEPRYERAASSVDVVVEGDRVVIATPAFVALWGPRGGKLTELGHWKTSVASLTIDGEAVYGTDGGHLLRLTSPERKVVVGTGMEIEKAYGRQRFAIPHEDGSITIYDHERPWSIGPRPVRYSRIRIGSDGRFLVAQTDKGGLWIWDLDDFAPTGMPLPVEEVMFGVTPGNVWTYTMERVSRHEIATGVTHTLALPLDAAFFTGGVVVAGGALLVSTQLVASPPNRYRLVALDVDSGRVVAVIENASTWYLGASNMTIQQGSRLVEWSAEPFTARELVQLPEAPHAFARSGSILAIALGGGVVRRIDLASHASTDLKVSGEIDQLLVDHGTIWCAVGSTVWKLELGAPPRRFDAPQPVVDLASTAVGPIAATADAIVTLSGPIRISPASRDRWLASSEADRFVVWVGPKHEPEVFDPASGAGFRLSDQEISMASVAKNRIILRTVDSLSEWTMTVPTEPVALRRWLDTVTNVRTMPGSEVLFWPSP